MVTTNDFPSFCAKFFFFDYVVVVEMGDEAILFIQIVGTLQCTQDERRWRWKAGEESLKAREGAKGRESRFRAATAAAGEVASAAVCARQREQRGRQWRSSARS